MEKKNFKMNNLRTLRDQNKLTQINLSSKINISQELLSQYEIGTSLPNILNLIKLADFFNVSIDYLVGRTNNTSPIKDLNKNELKCASFYKKYESLNPSQKKQLDNFLEFLISQK